MAFVLTILYIVVAIVSLEQFGKEWISYHALTYLAGITFFASLPNLKIYRYWKSSVQLFLLLGFVVAIALSHVANGWLGGVLESWRAFLPSAAVFFFIIVNVTTIQQLKIATLASVSACLAVAVEALFGYYAGFQGEMFILRTNIYSLQEVVTGQLVRIRGAGFLSDPNDFAQILLVALPLLVIFWRKGHKAANFFLVLVPAALLLWTTYLTHSRGGLIALAALALVAGRRKLGTTASMVLAAVLIIGMIGLDFTGGRGISAADGSDRLEAWASGLEMFKSSPLFGIGFNAFTDFYEITAHNSFVLCLAELGMLGSVLWLALLVATTMGLSRIIGEQEKKSAKKLFGLLPLFEAGFIRGTRALDSCPISLDGTVALNDAAYFSGLPITATAAGIEVETTSENSYPIVPMDWVVTMRLALVSFMTTSWFLSRTYAITMYLVLGLATATIALQQPASKSTDRGHWIFSTVALECALIVLIYILVRFRH